MKRIVQDYATMSDELRQLVQAAYPDGIERSDLVAFPMAGGKRLYAIEIRTEEAIYLVKGDFAHAVERRGFIVLDQIAEDDEED